MAQRRMFSKTITNSSQFLRMPISSRLLYYDLGMNADDDGFVEHFMVLRMTGATQQDLGVLELNGLIKVFDDNVLWIKDWKENNYIQKDRYNPSKYLSIYTIEQDIIPVKEKKQLSEARIKRLEAKKNSDLPTTFEQQIRNAFIGRECPICKKIMTYDSNLTKPSIQHNVPISLGGKHELDNISVICVSCNTSIQNKQITPPYNTELVKQIWESIGNVYTGKVRLELGKDSIYEHIEQEFGRPLSPIEYEIVGSWEDNDLTRYAIKQAILNNAPRIKYIQAILNSYKSKNIKTVSEAQEDEKRYKNRTSNNQTKPNWMDEEIEKETISDEEKKELQNLMEEFE